MKATFLFILCLVAVLSSAQVNCGSVYVSTQSNRNVFLDPYSNTSDTICSGESDTLTAHGGTSYLWSTSATTAAIIVSPSQTATYTVTITDGNSCNVNQTLTVMNTPTASISPSGDTIVTCQSTVTLTASGGNVYLWSTGANTSSITVTPTQQPTTYQVNVGVAFATCAGTTKVTLASLQQAYISPSNQNINTGGNAQFALSPPQPGASYQWQTNSGLGWQTVSNAGQYSGATNDTMTVSNVTTLNNNQLFRCIVSGDSCADTSNVGTLIVLNSTGIANIVMVNDFTVYPNPAIEQLTVNLNSYGNMAIKMFDEFGREVYTQALDAAQQNQSLHISTNNVANGIYVLQVVGQAGAISKRIVVQK